MRYSPTAAVTECSEWIADNTSSSSTCCLYTHVQICMHADTHSLYQSQGFCQCRCQHYQTYFSPVQFSRSQIRAKVMYVYAHAQTCVCVFVVIAAVTCAIALARSPPFLFSEQTFVCLYLYYVCTCVRFCACCCIEEHRSLRQCRGLWQRKQIFVPLPPTGKGSYTHNTPLWSHMHTLTHRESKCNHAVHEH